MSGKTTGERTVDLYLCAEPQFGVETQKEAVIDRLTALEREDLIDEFGVYIWGREIRPDGPLEGTDYHRLVLDSVREFEEWLRRHGASADHLFKRRGVDSEIIDETYTVISLPTMCLAVYDDGDLSGVYPYDDAEGTHTVRECLAELEATDPRVAVDGVASERLRQ
jgi:hypothetical protein